MAISRSRSTVMWRGREAKTPMFKQAKVQSIYIHDRTKAVAQAQAQARPAQCARARPCLMPHTSAIRHGAGHRIQPDRRAHTDMRAHTTNHTCMRTHAHACMHVGMRAPPCSNNAPTSSMPATDRAWLISLACLRPAGRPRAACSPRRPLSSSIGSHEPRRACERWEA